MKNILSSLNESEKKRIIEMHTNKKSFLFEAVETKIQLDCVAKTVNQIVVSQADLLANLCPAAKNTTTQNTTATESVTKNMVNFKSSVINDLLAGFGAKSVEVFGDTDVKPPRVGLVLFQMLKPLSDPNLGELTPTYQCARVPGQGEAGETKSYQKYFKYGSNEYNLFVAAAKKQCQASQLKIQGK